MSNNRDVATIATLLADESARMILTETAKEPMSAEALSEQSTVSTPTIYRRLTDLKEHDLISEQIRLDSDGHHYKVYAAMLDQVTVNLTEDGFELHITRRERMADRFTQFIEDMR